MRSPRDHEDENAPPLYSDNQHDDTLDAGGLRPFAEPTLRAIDWIATIRAHPARPKCESPIEERLLGSLLKRCPYLDIRAQVKIDHYRVDFLIEGWLIVECDGREFHSTFQQRVRDQARDAALLELGFVVLRLTGSQIHRGEGLDAIEELVAGPKIICIEK